MIKLIVFFLIEYIVKSKCFKMVILNGWEVEVKVLLICENKIDIFVN